VCAGAVYVVGFTLLHENVDDELRGRIFSVLYTIVRLCLLIAFALGPFLSELLDRVSNHFFTNRSISVLGKHLFIPGERLTLWLAGVIIIVAGAIVFWSLRAGENAQLKADADRV
jgi:dTMP kinase